MCYCKWKIICYCLDHVLFNFPSKKNIESHLKYCSLTWTLHSRISNNKINLLLIYNDQTSSFEKLRKKENPFTVLHFNTQSLAIEMFKVSNNIAPTIIDDLIAKYCHSYDLW